ncbi:MAG: helix-turn-helix domain-containing protein [Treponema sp.]|jgi:DNA-binding XRE family transcriptional regulator|nr:helix-turn-helix domain-containing protein [Treponema sp.]
MLAHTKKPFIKTECPAAKRSGAVDMQFFVSCPAPSAYRIKHYLEEHGCVCADAIPDYSHELADAKGLFAERTPGNLLIGARGKENITQVQLSELTGIPRRHISDMENGRRPIGKHNARKIGTALNISYRVFL